MQRNLAVFNCIPNLEGYRMQLYKNLNSNEGNNSLGQEDRKNFAIGKH